MTTTECKAKAAGHAHNKYRCCTSEVSAIGSELNSPQTPHSKVSEKVVSIVLDIVLAVCFDVQLSRDKNLV